jgi:hypothetical protein
MHGPVPFDSLQFDRCSDGRRRKGKGPGVVCVYVWVGLDEKLEGHNLARTRSLVVWLGSLEFLNELSLGFSSII